jgi:arsenite-transporting ATPase
LIEEGFTPLPIRAVPYFEQEVVGLEMLRRLGAALFGDDDPSVIFYHGRSYSVQRLDGGYRLELALPFMEKGDVAAKRVGEELLLEVGPYRRTLVLPRALAELQISSAHLNEGTLSITFKGADNART